MSWYRQILSQASGQRASIARRWWGRLAVLIPLALGPGPESAWAQDNPLRESIFSAAPGGSVDAGDAATGRGPGNDLGSGASYDASYLEQLLPSLQRLQSESDADRPPVDPGQTSDPSLAAGVWQAASGSGLSQRAAVTPVAVQTETRLTENRAGTGWSEPAWSESAERSGTRPDPRSSGATGLSPPPTEKNSPVSAAAAGGGARLRSRFSGGSGDRLTAFQGVESLQLDSTLVKVGLNTLLVLAATVGLIVVVRKTIPRPQANPPRTATRLQVEQTLKLGGKSELKVVRCGLNQVLVAIDGGGIRSVVALEPALETEREHLDPPVATAPPAVAQEPVNIEQFVKMIKDMEGDFMAARTSR